jgi:hypothetical protein
MTLGVAPGDEADQGYRFSARHNKKSVKICGICG